jgi:GT2 family glycosyltransferase
MKLSILVATYNNLQYLKLFLNSVEKNSNFKHQILIHVNDGSDGTLDFLKKKEYEFTHTDSNIGLCKSINLVSKKIDTDYILYAHDDMFFCKNWDLFLINEIKKMKNNKFYLAGTNVSVDRGLINYDCGSSFNNFNEEKFNLFCLNDNSENLQSSHWSPHLIHKELWNKIGGFSEEFNPGDASDPDLCMKLWNNDVRIFKCISKFKVYHFNSVTTRKSNLKLNNGTRTFILKYKMNPKFFRKYFLNGEILRIYKGELSKPNYSFQMFIDLLINRLKYFYFKIISIL